MAEVIEDALTRQRQFQKEQNAKLEYMIRMNAPDILIEEQRKIASMSLFEYGGYRRQQREDYKKSCIEYAKTHKIQREVVDAIYNRAESVKNAEYRYVFIQELNLKEFMSDDDIEYNLYESFIDHAYELYCKRSVS